MKNMKHISAKLDACQHSLKQCLKIYFCDKCVSQLIVDSYRFDWAIASIHLPYEKKWVKKLSELATFVSAFICVKIK